MEEVVVMAAVTKAIVDKCVAEKWDASQRKAATEVPKAAPEVLASFEAERARGAKALAAAPAARKSRCGEVLDHMVQLLPQGRDAWFKETWAQVRTQLVTGCVQRPENKASDDCFLRAKTVDAAKMCP